MIRRLFLALFLFALCSAPVQAAVVVTSDIQYKAGPLLLDSYVKDTAVNAPCLLIIHGGGWTGGSKTAADVVSAGNLFATIGFSVFAVEYTLVGGAPQTPITDILDAVSWARSNAQTYDGNPDRVYLLGMSAGAHLGLMAGIQGTANGSRPDAIVAWSPPSNLGALNPTGSTFAALYMGTLYAGNEAAWDAKSPTLAITSNMPRFRIVGSASEVELDGGITQAQYDALETAGIAAIGASNVAKKIFAGTVHSDFRGVSNASGDVSDASAWLLESDSALHFGAVSTDVVTIAADTELNTLNPFTLILWIKPITLTTNAQFWGKGNASLLIRLSGTTGNVELLRALSSVNVDYITNTTPLAVAVAGTWNCIAISHSTAAGAGAKVAVYSSIFGEDLAADTFGTATDGSVTVNSDAASQITVGNNASPFNSGIVAGIGPIAQFGAVLSLSDAQTWCNNPAAVIGANTARVMLAMNATGTLTDLSGNGNSGTVSGPTVIPGPPFDEYVAPIESSVPCVMSFSPSSRGIRYFPPGSCVSMGVSR